MPTQEALFKARQKGLDLVEVAPKAKPPVCKIIDFNKFKYQEDKKQRAGKKGIKKQVLKEVRLTPFIASQDYQVRLKKVQEFLSQGHKVRLTVKFVGRQITRKKFGYELLEKAAKQLAETAQVESEPKFQGKLLAMVFRPRKSSAEKKDKCQK